MSFNPPPRSQPAPTRSQPAGNASPHPFASPRPRNASPRPLSSSQLESELNTSQEIIIAAALAVRNSVKKRSMVSLLVEWYSPLFSIIYRVRIVVIAHWIEADLMHRMYFSLNSFNIEYFSTTSTPLRSRSPNASATEVDSRSTSVPPLTRKTSVRALFTTSTPSAFLNINFFKNMYTNFTNRADWAKGWWVEAGQQSHFRRWNGEVCALQMAVLHIYFIHIVLAVLLVFFLCDHGI